MTTLQVKLDLPDNLAKEATNLGLLEPQALQTMLWEAVRQRRIARLIEARQRSISWCLDTRDLRP